MRKAVRGLYQRGGDGAFLYDFVFRGHRFCGATGLANRRDAESWLKTFRARKAAEIEQLDGRAPMSFGAASTRWFAERGQHRKDARDIERFLAWLQGEIGMATPIAAINDNAVARLVARRRADGVSNGTVNRSAVEPLRAILARAALWGQKVPTIDWKAHKLREAPGRVREISREDEGRLFAALRCDFHAVAKFLLATGLRRAEACNLEWTDVDLETRFVTVRGKGDTLDRRPLPASAVAILAAEIGRHPLRVFTYEVRHAWGGRKGARKPIAPDTLGTAFWRARRAAGLADVRLHDLRHTAASRIVRATGNIAAAGKALGHTRITTTQRYAHLNAEDVRAALDAAAPIEIAAAESPADVPQAVKRAARKR